MFCRRLTIAASIFRYCGVKDPSWAEIRHFVRFLDLQLQSCENSYFTNKDFVGDVLGGFKNFVVKFMTQMSRVSVCVHNSILHGCLCC